MPDLARLHVEKARHQLVAADDLEQLAELRLGRDRLEHELQRAAAGQVEALRLLGGHAVGQRRRLALRQRVVAHLVDHVVLDAAAGHRAHHVAVVADDQHRAHRAGRGAPRAHHRRERGAAAFVLPGLRGPQHFEIDTVHRTALLRAT